VWWRKRSVAFTSSDHQGWLEFGGNRKIDECMVVEPWSSRKAFVSWIVDVHDALMVTESAAKKEK